MKSPSRTWLQWSGLPAFLCVLLATFLITVSFSPGCMNPDTNDMWGQSTRRIYDNWHPETFSILWTYLRYIYNGTESMLVLQLLAFTTGLVMTVAVASRVWVRCLLFFSAIIVPSVLALLGTITKDSVMGCMLVLAAGCCFAYARSHSKILFGCGLAASYLAFAVRHNGLIAVFPLLILLFWDLFTRQKARRRFLLAPAFATICLLSFLGIQEITLQVYRVRRRHPEQRLLLHDLGELSVLSNKELAPPAFVLPGATVDGIRQTLQASNGDWLLFGAKPVFRGSENPNELRALTVAWAKAVVARPKDYLLWRAQVFSAFAGFEGPVLDPYMEVCQAPYGTGVAIASGPFYRVAMAWLTRFGTSLFFRPYVYMTLLLAVTGFGVWKRRLDFVLIATGCFLYTVTYFFLIQQCTFRYACPAVFVAVILIARIVAEQTRVMASAPIPHSPAARTASDSNARQQSRNLPGSASRRDKDGDSEARRRRTRATRR